MGFTESKKADSLAIDECYLSEIDDYPDLFQPYGGFPDDVRVEDGYIVLPDLSGIGFEGRAVLAICCESRVWQVNPFAGAHAFEPVKS